MKKFGKFLLGGAFALGLSLSGILTPKEVNASTVLKNPDITPPKGIVKVAGATLRNGVYYTNSTSVTLNISATDDRAGDLMMIVSNTPIQGSIAVDDSKWEAYSTTKAWTLSSVTDECLIYLYLKDAAGNISPNIITDVASTYTVTYAGEGTGLPAPKEAKFGMAFNVAIEEPKLEGKYFLGWSEVNGGSVQWLSDSVIESKYIKGDKTLYAVYSETAPKLADQVEIGDYINYPAEYENIYSYDGGYKSAYTGWRVLDITDDDVTLVSAGTPLLYQKTKNSADSIEDLTTNFYNIENYADNGFERYYTNLEEVFTTGEAGTYTTKVEAMNKNDIDKIAGETTSIRSYNK